MRFFKQLEFIFGGTRSPSALVKIFAPSARDSASSSPPSQSYGVPRERPIQLRKRDHALESQARELLRSLGAEELARKIRVEWNPRLKTCAGRADYREKLISLNPLLREFVAVSTQAHFNCANVVIRDSRIATDVDRKTVTDEIGRTLRHELAHLLAQWREKSRRRIAPHGAEWRQACRDLGIADEARCHNLPFAANVLPPRYVYRCPNCKEEFPRVRRIRRAIACLKCCRAHNRGEFDPRFRLRLVSKT